MALHDCALHDALKDKSVKAARENLSQPKISEVSVGKATIRHQDVIQFLSTLPSESIDLVVTDPAYSGMNQHLKLGKGRIVGQYNQKGSTGKWFDEFHDTPENYIHGGRWS